MTARRDLAWSYAASGARVAAWAALSAMVYRRGGAEALALLVGARFLLMPIAYASAALYATLIPQFAQLGPPLSATWDDRPPGDELSYAVPPRPRPYTEREVTRRLVAGLTALAGIAAIGLLALVVARGTWTQSVPAVPAENPGLTMFFIGLAVIARMASEGAGARLAATGRLAVDNRIQVIGEVLVVIAAWFASDERPVAANVAGSLCVGSLWVAAARFRFQPRMPRGPYDLRWAHVSFALLFAANLTDYLYAPAAFLLIDRLLGPIASAAYAPALQVDAALLLLTSGLAAVVLPRSARVVANGDYAALRRLYVRGTLVSLALLVPAAVGAWAAAPWVLKLWLGEPVPLTLSVLPMVLVHTVVGGSAGIARGVLIGAGRFGAWAWSALAGGVLNVTLAVAFVKLGWGLHGVVLATVLAVTLRCAVWLPWYTLRATAPRSV